MEKLDKNIIDVASLVRYSILDVIEQDPKMNLPSTEYDLMGWCGVASFILAEELEKIGVACSVWEGTYKDTSHAWNIVDNHILDITATQFGLENIHVVKAYEKGCGYKPEKCIKKRDDFKGWPDEQKPNEFLCKKVRNAFSC